MFDDTRAADRAALVGYLPGGYPDIEQSKALFGAMIDGGCDLVEVGFPYSDPVMDGPVIQNAAETARRGGFRITHLFEIVQSIADRGGRAVVMTYFNPVLAYGQDRFARDLANAGGLGVITPDVIVDEAAEWLAASRTHGIDSIFLVAPSSPLERIAITAASATGFIYAASTMGVTGARDSVGSAAPALVERCRTVTDTPIGVGLGVRTAAQVREIGAYADAVIVGSALVSAAGSSTDPAAATEAVRALTAELATGTAR
ncbi:tryptophan synthase subunit alpha [Nakamurella deserti]|uniref:tryptophan synthase subunit alpha n=1 Tax=Nakamurella deserti TaxID=2164074 RepID=UPI000DBE5894